MSILSPVFPHVVRLLDDALRPGAASAFPCCFRRGSLTDTAVEVPVLFDQRCPFAPGQGVTGDSPVPEQAVRLWA
jgi:hypothetical protein